MDYKNTADMISLGLFILLTGLILLVVPDFAAIQTYYDFGEALRNRIIEMGLVLFNAAGIFLLIVLIRWAYRVSTKHSQGVRNRMNEMEKP